MLSRVPTPDLKPLAEAFNNALTGDDEGRLPEACNDLVRARLDAAIVIRITTFLAETFTDEADTSSGAVTKSLVSTLGHVCGLMVTTMVAAVTVPVEQDTAATPLLCRTELTRFIGRSVPVPFFCAPTVRTLAVVFQSSAPHSPLLVSVKVL